MIRPPSHRVFLSLAMAAVPCGLAAQGVTVRERQVFFTVTDVGGHGTLVCRGNGDGTSTLTWKRPSATTAVSLAFERPGDACRLDPDSYLVTGLDLDPASAPIGTMAYIVTLDVGQAAITVEQSHLFANADLCRLYHNQGEQLVYAYD